MFDGLSIWFYKHPLVAIILYLALTCTRAYLAMRKGTTGSRLSDLLIASVFLLWSLAIVITPYVIDERVSTSSFVWALVGAGFSGIDLWSIEFGTYPPDFKGTYAKTKIFVLIALVVFWISSGVISF